MAWNKKNVHFGHVAPKSTQKFEFVYTGSKEIEQVRTGCSCTTANVKDNSFTVKWDVGPINGRRVLKKERIIKVKFKNEVKLEELKLEAMLQRELP